MGVLFDTNAILDYILVREPQYKNVLNLIDLSQQRRIKTYVTFHSLSIIWYFMRKNFSPIERRKFLLKVASVFIVVSATQDAVVEAILNENFPDFEDCLQEKCALNVNADYIVTNNIKDFAASKVPAVTPAEMVEIILN